MICVKVKRKPYTPTHIWTVKLAELACDAYSSLVHSQVRFTLDDVSSQKNEKVQSILDVPCWP